jgi:hypothetical protein
MQHTNALINSNYQVFTLLTQIKFKKIADIRDVSPCGP